MSEGMSVMGALLVAALVAVPASAQEMSEKSVKSFMNYAWSLVPSQFTPPSGKTIIIDKKKKDEILVPVDAAREVIKVGRLSAHAQICDLKAEQICNYQSLMKRELDKKSWSEQQIVYISQLHLTTVMLLTGKIKLVEKDGDKEVVIDDTSSAVAQTCSAEQKTKVKEVIDAYVKAGPKLRAGTCGFGS
ncbi:MAG: hypothetical protein NW205_05100 [Hyphomicrobiaceae bacterium]|nr:hypothetical protein [Hyphomicrobiaceae bacterium]